MSNAMTGMKLGANVIVEPSKECIIEILIVQQNTKIASFSVLMGM